MFEDQLNPYCTVQYMLNCTVHVLYSTVQYMLKRWVPLRCHFNLHLAVSCSFAMQALRRWGAPGALTEKVRRGKAGPKVVLLLWSEAGNLSPRP